MLAIVVATIAHVFAQTTATLAGTVTAQGAPVAGATVQAVGASAHATATSDAKGAFAFPGLAPGAYTITAAAVAGSASVAVTLAAGGTTVPIALAPIKQIGRTNVNSRPPVTGSGTDVTLRAENLTRSPAGGSLPDLLVQLPGAARGANGVVHLNGDHGDINYVVDGVQVPQALNRSIGSEFDPNDLSSIDVLQGAYPAQYGERFAAVINLTSKVGNGPSGFTGDFNLGSYANYDTTLGYHTDVGKGSLQIATRNEQGDRGLDPPNFSSPHNAFSDENQFLRFTQPVGNDFVNLTMSHSYQTFQIPNDVQNGEPATTDDNETQDDFFAALEYRHPIGDHGELSFGPSYKRSRIRDFGDAANDFTFGAAGNIAAGGGATDCANALASNGGVVNGVVTSPVADTGVNYANTTCGYSLFGDRTATDISGNLDYENRSAHHTIRFGGLYDATNVAKTYDVTLQPGNFLAPIFTPATPNAAYTVVDDAPNVGHLAAAYLQDSWKMGTAYQLDYGLRADTFLVSSTQFDDGSSMTSPRVKLTRFLGGRNSVYAFYGRFFTPFSLENVSPLAAYTLNIPLQSAVAAFDLKPERDSVYEIGGHVGLGRGDLGLRVMQKDATDLLDDTQVGVTNLHQDINYALGRIATQTAYYQIGLARAGRFYASVTHTYSVNKGCETQLLAPCYGASNDWTPADHDQRIDVTSGILVNNRHDGWFAVDGEYGSGLSTILQPNTGGITCGGPTGATGGPCKLTPHVTFDAQKGIGLGNGTALTFKVQNLLNDRYFVTFNNASGNHYASPRTFAIGLRLNTK